MIDRCVAQAKDRGAQEAAVARLQEMEQGNVRTARRLLGLPETAEKGDMAQ